MDQETRSLSVISPFTEHQIQASPCANILRMFSFLKTSLGYNHHPPLREVKMEAQRNEVTVKEYCHSQVYLSESDMYPSCYVASKIRVLEMIKGATMNIII